MYKLWGSLSLLTASLIMVSVFPVAMAQDGMCTFEGVAASYATAIASNKETLEWWYENYANSACSADIIEFAYDLANIQRGPEITQLAPAENSFDAALPSGFRLEEPGIYLYSQRIAVPLPEVTSLVFSPSLNQIYFPQSQSANPLILLWSTELSLESLSLYKLIGGIGVSLDETDSGRVVMYLDRIGIAGKLGIHDGDILLSIDGTTIENSVELASSLLQGDIGTSVDITYLRGTQRQTARLTRQMVGFEILDYDVEFWNDNTVILNATQHLVAGIYCYSASQTWCFEVVSELEPTPTPSLSPMSTSIAAQVTAFRGGSIPTDIIIRGTIEPGQTVQGTVDTFVDDGWTFSGAEGLRYNVEVKASGSNLDTEVSLYDTSGALVGYSDDITLGSDTNSRLEITLPSDGQFLIGVSAVGTGGDYMLIFTGEEVPTSTPQATLPAVSRESQVQIQVIDAGILGREAVEIINSGKVLDLTGWTLSDAQSHIYTFPAHRLFTNGLVTVYTGQGTETPNSLFWGLNSLVWQPGTIAILSDANGDIQAVDRVD